MLLPQNFAASRPGMLLENSSVAPNRRYTNRHMHPPRKSSTCHHAPIAPALIKWLKHADYDEATQPLLRTLCPAGLEELCLSMPPVYDIKAFDSAFEGLVTPMSSLRTLQLRDMALPDAPRFSALSALQDLRVITPCARYQPACWATVVPALSRLTRLEHAVNSEGDKIDNRNVDSRQGQLSHILRTLGMLQSLRYLQVGGTAYDYAQLPEGKPACPALEVLILDALIEGNESFLAFFDHPGRLTTVSVTVSDIKVDGREQEQMRFRAALAQRTSLFVNFTVQKWSRFLDCSSSTSSASGLDSDADDQ